MLLITHVIGTSSFVIIRLIIMKGHWAIGVGSNRGVSKSINFHFTEIEYTWYMTPGVDILLYKLFQILYFISKTTSLEALSV